MRSPRISVVIPTHNRWALLSRALASVVAQTEPDLEVLVVDDASTDETPERLPAIRGPRIRALRQEPNQGVARARNRAIEEARGEWVAFLDDDDLWAPDRLRLHLEAAEGAAAGWAFGTAISLNPEGEPFKLLEAPDPAALSEGLLRANVVGPPSAVMARTELLREVGGFDEALTVLADWDLWIRLGQRANAASCDTPLVAYCEHGDNMQRTRREATRADMKYLAAKHASLLPADGSFGTPVAERIAVVDHRRAGRRFRAGLGYLRIGARERSPREMLRGVGMFAGERVVARLGGAVRPSIASPPWLAPAFHASLGEPGAGERAA